MNTKIIVKVSDNQNLEITSEIKCKLQPDREYEMTFNEGEIIFKKIPTPVTTKTSSILRQGSGKSLLKHAGTWKGDDFEECLQAVYDNRSQIQI